MMQRWVRRWVLAAFVFATAAAPGLAQGTVDVVGPFGNPITSGIGTFSIRTANFQANDFPLRLELQVSRTPDFSAPLFADTLVDGPNADITIPRLLPSSGELYWRAFAFTARVGSEGSVITGPRDAPTHLSLISPNNAAGQSLSTTRPTFVWHASTIPPSVGAWTFEVDVQETATAHIVAVINTTDTVATLTSDLETNTSYRWSVIARLAATHDSLQVQSFASFVLLSDNAPLTTLLLNPFPTPFPSVSGANACIWFDLQSASNVTLDIIDMRGRAVKRIVPGPSVSGNLPAGRYGRPSPGATSGCDDRFSWNGTDREGHTVPKGIYLVVLNVAGHPYRNRLVFNGR